MIDEFNIPIREHLRRVKVSEQSWAEKKKAITGNKNLPRHRSHEYASYIIEAMQTDCPMRINGNVLNKGLITNLPSKAVVEVPCLIDRSGIHGCVVGDLPEQCAALNRTNINVQCLAVEAILRSSREAVYHAAYLDPHAAGELTLDQIRAMCDELMAAHNKYLSFLK